MILITGSTGLLGSHLLRELAVSGEPIRLLVRHNSDRKLIQKVAGDVLSSANIEWFEGDITDVLSVKDAMQGVTRVFHCAGMVSFQPGQEDRLMEVNTDGTANVVNMALEAGIEHLVHVSSIAALGRNSDGEHIDEQAVWKTSSRNSKYAISKYSAEREVWRGIAEGLNAAIVNPGVVVGPGDWRTDSSMIFGQVWRGLKFYTRGVNGFVDVRDVARAMCLLSEQRISSQRYVLVSKNVPFREVFDMIADKLGKKRAYIFAGPTLSGFAWRAEWLRGKITGSKPVITRETARSANGIYFYSAEKFKRQFGFDFIPVSQSIADAAAVFLREKKG